MLGTGARDCRQDDSEVFYFSAVELENSLCVRRTYAINQGTHISREFTTRVFPASYSNNGDYSNIRYAIT